MKLKPYPKYKDSGIEWLGKIPEGWEVRKLRHLCKGNFQYGANEEAIDNNPDNPRYIRITDINDDGSLREDTFKSLPKDKASPFLLKKGDILFARSGATVGKTFQYKESWGKCCYAGYLVKMSPDPSKVESDFIYYFTKSHSYNSWKDSIFIQATIQNISADKYKNLQICIPDITEQRKIVNFLNEKTRKIDELIRRKEKLIDLLREKRQAIISHAVTKGLDPNVKMKDSGIEWLGEIPEEWEVTSLRRIGRVVNGGTPNSSNEEYWNGEIVWITPEDLGNNDEKYINESKRKISYKGYINSGTTLVPKDSLIISTRAPIGHIALSSTEVCFNQGCRGIIFHKPFYPSFYYYYFLAIKDILNAYGQGTTFFELSANKLASINVVIPSIQEQKQIVNYLDKQTAKIDTVIKKIQTQIEKLKEYRQILISNVVTGKVKVG